MQDLFYYILGLPPAAILFMVELSSFVIREVAMGYAMWSRWQRIFQRYSLNHG